jgi:hypothetical protein
MDGACSTHGRNEKCKQYFGRKGRDHLQDRSVDWRIILEWILGKYGGKAWTDASGSG